MAYADVAKRNEYARKWGAKRRAKQTSAQKSAHAIYMQKYYRENPEKARADRLSRKFGITPQQYNECFQAQKGCCAICGTHQSKLRRALNVDHCHETGRNRSLLCDKCNVVLGLFNDDPIRLEKAAAYLRFHAERED